MTQLENLGDLDALNKMYETTMSAGEDTAKISAVEPSEIITAEQVAESADQWRKTGLQAMAAGQVALVVLSGGQGTRLGFSGPKGCYDIGLPSGKSLFQLHAERLLKLKRETGGKIPWYIMTSPLNHAATEAFFAEHNFFGLPEEDVMFFSQGTLPCFADDGKFIMENKNKVASAPDGNGGIYSSMLKKGVLSDMKTRGVKYVHAYAVDNALVQVADPVFMGACIGSGAQVGNKSCPKASWDEKVGVMARKNDRYCVVEYSEISEEMAKQTDTEGRLLFGSGNICNHWYTLDFIENTAVPNLGNSYHVARKKIPHADPSTGKMVKPEEVNGVKLEMFIFDVFPLADKMTLMESHREEEFSPVKNAPGAKTDSPDTARSLIAALHRKWLQQNKVKVSGEKDGIVEVSPLVSYCGQTGLEMLAGQELQAPCLVQLREEATAANTQLDKPIADLADGTFLFHGISENKIHIYTIGKN